MHHRPADTLDFSNQGDVRLVWHWDSAMCIVDSLLDWTKVEQVENLPIDSTCKYSP